MRSPAGGGLRPTWRAVRWAAAGAGAAAMLPSLWLRWYGDQALFMHMALRAADGDVFGVDIWDNKQPGVFWLYRFALRVFGEHGVAPHLLGWLLWLAAGAVAVRTVRRVTQDRLAAAAVPAIVGGTVALWNDAGTLAQVESFAAPALAAVIHLAATTRADDRRVFPRYVAFGVVAGALFCLKITLLAVPVAVLGLALLLDARSGRPPSTLAVLRAVAGAALGGVTTLGLAAAYLAVEGSLDEVLWTTFTYPRLAEAEIPLAPPLRLLRSVAVLVLAAAPWLALAVWRTPAVVRGARDPRRRAVVLVWWQVAVTAVTVLVQKFSWWNYQFAVFVVPLAVLAALVVAGDTRRHRVRALVLVALAWSLLGGGKALVQVGHQTDTGRRVLGLDVQVEAAAALDAYDALGLAAAPGGCRTAYVFGDPTIMLALDARPAMATHGWAWEFFLDAQLDRLPSELGAARPTVVFVQRFFADLLADESPDTLDVLRASYRPVPARGAADGTWWVLEDDDGLGCTRRVRFTVP